MPGGRTPRLCGHIVKYIYVLHIRSLYSFIGGGRGVQKSYIRKLPNLINIGVQRSQETKYTTMRIQGMDDLVANPGINEIYNFKGVFVPDGCLSYKVCLHKLLFSFHPGCATSNCSINFLLYVAKIWASFMYMKFKDTIIMLFGPSRLPPLLPFI